MKVLPRTDVSRDGNERDAGSARGPDRLDLIGLGLAGAFLAWTVISAVVGGGNPVAPALVLLTSAAVFFVARRATAASPAVVPSLALAAGILLVAADPAGTYSSEAGSGAFGYANAKAAFSLLAAVAGLMIALVSGSTRLRIGALFAAVGFALVPVASDARAAAVVAAGLPVAALVALRGGPRRVLLTACAVVVLASSLGTTALAIAGDAASLGQTLDRRRVRLWEEAADLMEGHPWFGVGPGRFPEESPTGGSDEDARWAHNDFLHQGAETGIPGFVLLLSLFLWALVRIGTAASPTPTALLAAFAVAALATMASFDHVLNFPLIAAAGAALAGAGAPLGRRREWQPGGSARALVKSAALPLGLAARRRPGDVAILLYHRVGVGGREIDVPAGAFDEQMAMVSESGEVRSLEEALLDERGGVVVTFDDGFRDFHEHTLPTLARYRVPAVLYLATGLIDGSPEALTWSQLEEVVSTGLVEVGGHTHGHTDLSRADEGTAGMEMRRCRDLIEDRLGRKCRHFAYPWAVGSSAADRIARALFDSAALDAWRTNRRGQIDLHRLGRTPVLRGDGSLFFRAKVQGMLDAEGIAYRLLRRGPWRP